MKLKLIVLAGAKEGTEIPLKKDKFLIGRAKECALRAGSEAISRRHCAIIRRDTGWTVRDLGSRNGTHVNEEKIAAEVPLKDGDELRVGPLKFRVAARESSAPAPVANSGGPRVGRANINRRQQRRIRRLAEAPRLTTDSGGSRASRNCSALRRRVR